MFNGSRNMNYQLGINNYSKVGIIVVISINFSFLQIIHNPSDLILQCEDEMTKVKHCARIHIILLLQRTKYYISFELYIQHAT